jgi:hypothetical protein
MDKQMDRHVRTQDWQKMETDLHWERGQGTSRTSRFWHHHISSAQRAACSESGREREAWQFLQPGDLPRYTARREETEVRSPLMMRIWRSALGLSSAVVCRCRRRRPRRRQRSRGWRVKMQGCAKSTWSCRRRSPTSQPRCLPGSACSAWYTGRAEREGARRRSTTTGRPPISSALSRTGRRPSLAQRRFVLISSCPSALDVPVSTFRHACDGALVFFLKSRRCGSAIRSLCICGGLALAVENVAADTTARLSGTVRVRPRMLGSPGRSGR